jgi:hypothetical protein
MLLLMACVRPAFADAWTPQIVGVPTVSACPPTQPPANPGSDPGLPGIWYNPQRAGAGWELNFVPNPSAPNTNALDIVWLTYDALKRPVWLTNEGVTLHSVHAGAETFQAPLYWVTLVNNQLTSSQVGEVAVTFVPGSTTQAVVWWQWNAIDSSIRKECIYNWFKGQVPSQVPSQPDNPDGVVNETYTGAWASGLWSLFVNVNTDANVSSTKEVEYVGLYDAAGQPVWMMSDPIYSPTTAWTTKNLAYVKSNYQ